MSTISNIGAKKWAHTMRDIQKKSYWVIGLLLLGFSAYFYYTGLNKPVAGVLWFLGGFLIWYYYWVKWFVMDQPPDPDFYTASGACPDYLSVIPNDSGLYQPTTKTQYFCVDFVGVSRNGGIRKMNRNNINVQIADPAYRFSVDPEIDFATPASKAAFVRRLEMAGLSYNSVGDISLPTMGAASNGAPAFGGGSISTVVPTVPSGLVATTGSAGMTGGMGTTAPGALMSASASAAAPLITGANTVMPPMPSKPVVTTGSVGMTGGMGTTAPGALMSASASAAAPVFTGVPQTPSGSVATSGGSLITPQAIAEAINYTVASGKMQSLQNGTQEQAMQFANTILTDEISKGYLPAGTTVEQIKTAGQEMSKGGAAGNVELIAKVIPLLTPEALVLVKAAMSNGPGSMLGGGMGGGTGGM